MTESNTVLPPRQTEEEIDEANLISAARQDPKKFGGLYLLYVEKVFRYLYSRIGNVQEAEDVTAQTFLAAFEAFAQFRQDGLFAAWLFSIARNKAMDHFRRRKTNSPIEDADTILILDDPLHKIIRSEQTAILSKLIQSLPEDEQDLLRLRFLANMSFPEVAQLLHRNEDAVKKALYRLLARLQSQAEVFND